MRDCHERKIPEARCVGEQSHHIVVVGVVIDAREPEGIGQARMAKNRETAKTRNKGKDEAIPKVASPAVGVVDHSPEPSSADPIEENGLPPGGARTQIGHRACHVKLEPRASPPSLHRCPLGARRPQVECPARVPARCPQTHERCHP
jgi:hypothetical protein